MKRWLILVLIFSTSNVVLTAQGPKSAVIQSVEAKADLVTDISKKLWDYSETALKEHKSAAYMIDKLQQNGFRIRKAVAGMPTAFIASYGEGSPRIGILAEFDALPGVGNAKVPEKSPREDGLTSGQGCGHNLFGAASLGAAIALKEVMEANSIGGTIIFYGTPAEETVVGKVYMVRDGLFDGLDAAIDWHPGTETKVRNQPGRALNNFEIEFFGQAAHASGDPWNGRSALDAVELLNHGVNMMREHIKPTARIHYVIPNAGEAPNVVPEYAKVWYYVRDENREQVQKNYEWILKIAEGSALATGTRYKVRLITGVHEYLLNRPIQEAIQANLDLVGPVDFTEEEQLFARKLQAFLGIEEKGYDKEIKPLKPELEPVSGGSTDVAEVSWVTPTAGFSMTTAAADIPWHSWAASACHGTSGGYRAALKAAKVIALTGYDLLTDKDLLSKAHKSFQDSVQDRPYKSPLPPGQEPILPEDD